MRDHIVQIVVEFIYTDTFAPPLSKSYLHPCNNEILLKVNQLVVSTLMIKLKEK